MQVNGGHVLRGPEITKLCKVVKCIAMNHADSIRRLLHITALLGSSRHIRKTRGTTRVRRTVTWVRFLCTIDIVGQLEQGVARDSCRVLYMHGF